jgi:DNA-binding NtrC family response regulator
MEEKFKLLVVDDEEDMLVFATEVFRRNGFTVFSCLDGTQGLEVFQEQRPQIVLIDIHMPYSSLSGLDLLRRIKEIEKDTICIIVTRITDKDKIEESKRLGALHYITKPLDSKELLEIVNRSIQEIKNKSTP